MKPALPTTLQQAIIYFADPDRALEFLAGFRWPSGKPTCPRCDSTENSFISTRRVWKCKGCKKQFSVKVGTVLEDSPIGLEKWLPAIWMAVNCKNGISSYEIARDLGGFPEVGMVHATPDSPCAQGRVFRKKTLR